LKTDVSESEVRPEEYISAAELEKYGYCPLSWWYSREGADEADKAKLESGVRDHKEYESQLKLIDEYEGASKEAEASVAIFSIVATGLAMIALIISVNQTVEWSYAAIALALFWLLAAALFLTFSLKYTDRALKARRTSGVTQGQILDVGAAADTGDGILESK
jgi:CRISPR-associated exonuclease Cas4